MRSLVKQRWKKVQLGSYKSSGVKSLVNFRKFMRALKAPHLRKYASIQPSI